MPIEPHRGDGFFLSAEFEENLSPVECLALATAEELLFQPRNFLPQHQDLIPQELHFFEGNYVRVHDVHHWVSSQLADIEAAYANSAGR